MLTVLQVIGAVLAVVTVALPMAADTDTGTKVLLAVMHLVLGAAYWVALSLASRD